MTSIFSILLTLMSVVYWGFRIVVVLLAQLGREFFATPININYEIGLLFLSIPCIILVIKRNIVGAAGYLGLYVAYFGQALYDCIMNPSLGVNAIADTSNMLCIAIGILLPLLTFLDILFNKHRTLGTDVHKQDWYYANEKYDRKMDERADTNQYKV